MNTKAYVLFVPVEFPHGVAPGEGSGFNRLFIARDGNGDPVLRGSGLAGALRRSYSKRSGKTSEEVDSLFGEANDQNDIGRESTIRVSDAKIKIGKQGTVNRMHNLRSRHTGVVVDGGLYSVESCPPASHAMICIRFDPLPGSSELTKVTVEEIAQLFHDGFFVGGSRARGVGLVKVQPNSAPQFKEYDLSQPESYAAWLNDDYGWRANNSKPTGVQEIE